MLLINCGGEIVSAAEADLIIFPFFAQALRFL